MAVIDLRHGCGCLQQINLREYVICNWNRSKMVEEHEIESMFSNT